MSREVTGDDGPAGAAGTHLEADLDQPPDAGPAPGGPGGPTGSTGRSPSGGPVLGARFVVAALAVAVLVGVALVGAAGVVSRAPDRTDAAPTRTPSRTPDGPPSASPTPDPAVAARALPVDPGWLARVRPGGREGGDLSHVTARVEVTNTGAVPRLLFGVELLGLGTARVDRAPVDPLPPGGSVQLTATVAADCTARTRPASDVVVLVRGPDPTRGVVPVRAGTDLADDPRGALGPLCPAVRPGLRVTVAATGTDGGALVVRVVNHGNLTALVTPRAGPDAAGLALESEPGLPYDLAPGEAVVARLRVVATSGADRCRKRDPASAATAMFLEAETSYGFSEVTGFPTAALRTAVQRWSGQARCPHRA